MHEALSQDHSVDPERDAQIEIASLLVLATDAEKRIKPYIHETAKIAPVYGAETAGYRWRAALAILRLVKDALRPEDFGEMDVDAAVLRLKSRTPPLRPQQRAAAEMFLRNAHGDAYGRFLAETDALPSALRMRLRTEGLCLGAELRQIRAHRRGTATTRHAPRTAPSPGGTIAPLRRIL